jgi:hypothetical protein
MEEFYDETEDWERCRDDIDEEAARVMEAGE